MHFNQRNQNVTLPFVIVALQMISGVCPFCSTKTRISRKDLSVSWPHFSTTPAVAPTPDMDVLFQKEWQDYEMFRDTNLEEDLVDSFFARRPHVVASRLATISTTLFQARQRWDKRNANAKTRKLDHNTDNENIDESSSHLLATEKQGGESAAIAPLLLESEVDEARDLELCDAISSLGPVAVKIGQTLSQRPDIVGPDAAHALQRLQTQNVPFPNEWAFHAIRQELNWTSGAPLATNLLTNVDDGGLTDLESKPLFKEMTQDPVACASLGQVYKARLWDGREVAVKVQRPDAMSILAKDAQCFRKVFSTRRFIQNLMEGDSINKRIEGKNQDIGSVIDRVAMDIKNELDYRLEAQNSIDFRESLAFLGFVTTPEVVPELSAQRVLVTEWVKGRHLSDLTTDEGLAMTQMAVEACTASMVLTGFIHSDPHEGNLMLHDDGRVVFLDFGLMSRVGENIMEGFARGIQALLSEDWSTLAESFVDVGFVSQPIMHRNGVNDTWTSDQFGLNELSRDLSVAMEETEGGKARFGALATVLNKQISPIWLVYTPPYVLLLVRTFLTLEGIAAKVDPAFNIYEMAMPWAVRRSLSPSTEKGIEAFRSTIVTRDNRIQWSRLLQLTGPKGGSGQVDSTEALSRRKMSRQEEAKKAAMKEAVGSLLGNPQGRPLRRLLIDLDSTDLLNQLSSREGRDLLKDALVSSNLRNKQFNTSDQKQNMDSGGDSITSASFRPVSDEYKKLRKRETKWRRKVGRILVWSHVKRQMGWKGIKSMAKLLLAVVKVCASVLFKGILLKKDDAPKVDSGEQALGAI